MPRYKLTVEYDGTQYAGWQRQAEEPSVQQAIESAIAQFSQQQVILQVAGRTDAGVHATGQVAHFDSDKQYSEFRVREALNALLRQANQPVAILEVNQVADDFHARFSAQYRAYRYEILNRRAPLALDRYRAWQVIAELDCEAMQQAANQLIGHHDFSSFRAAECQANSPMKTLEKLSVERNNNNITIYVRSKSFLHNQVRIMVGSLVEVGKNRWSIDDFTNVREAKDRTKAGPTAPAHGLYLVEVGY